MTMQTDLTAGFPDAARPAMHYNDLIRDLAAQLETALRANASTGRRVYVRYWPAIMLRPGVLFVEVEGEPMPADPYATHRWPDKLPGPPIVRPMQGSWEAVAYSALYSQLWHRFRSERIMGPGDEV
jgi:hypothetical protein